MGLLDGRIALVTGAFQGNGAAIAIGLASHGARVVASDLQQPEQTAAKCSAFGLEAKAMIMNVADAKACDAAAAEIARDVGPVSIVVNNAGVCPRHTIDAPNLESAVGRNLKHQSHRRAECRSCLPADVARNPR